MSVSKHIFKLPDIGEGTAEAELVAWHVAVGDVVEEDQPVADVMTDKATVEITAPVSGKILVLHGTVGVASQVGSPLVEFEINDGTTEAPQSGLAEASESPMPPKAEVVPEAAPVTADIASNAPVDAADHQKPKATPVVRRRAKQLGVALENLVGTGPYGRIRQADLDSYLASAALTAAQPSAGAASVAPSSQGEFEEIKLVGLRRKIAEKMEISTRTIPHFAYVEEVDVTELEALRGRLNSRYGADRPKLSFLPFFVQALCTVLQDFPQINATYDEATGTLRRYRPIHVGIAAQTDAGLMVPVVRNAAGLGLWAIAAEISRLAAATRGGTAKRDELSGSTITITSLGPLAGVVTTPVINHPEVAIVGPNKIVERAMVRGGTVEIRKMMNISSSFDHRVVDGQDAAIFIQRIRELIENPELLLAK
jgi:2-oxoisovalerate dehydrogenase E2 component (dihydrolipoyl transacylase)